MADKKNRATTMKMKKITFCITMLSFCFIISIFMAGVKLYRTTEQYKQIPPNLDNYSTAEILFLAYERMRASTLTPDTWGSFQLKQQIFESKIRIIEEKNLHPDDFFYDEKITNLLKKLRSEDASLLTKYKNRTYANRVDIIPEMDAIKNTLIDIQEGIYRIQILRFNSMLDSIQDNSKATIIMTVIGVFFLITVFILLILQFLLLKQTIKEKNIFISTIYHEMSSSIQTILFASELINIRTKDENILKSNNKINFHSEKLLRQTREILDYSAVEIGKANIIKSSFDPKQLLNEIVKSINTERNTIKLYTTHLTQDIISDRMKLTGIVSNLIDNANKYTFHGLILINTRIWNGNFYLRIKDTGIGINPEHLPQIFKPFNQGSNGNSKQGLGLGLTIVKMNIQLLNGSIKIKSRPQKGTSLFLRIPVTFPPD